MIITKLYKIGFLSPKGLLFFIHGILQHGVNIFSLLYFSSRKYPNRLTFNSSITYKEAVDWAVSIAGYLYHEKNIESKSSIAILCENSVESNLAFFACTRLGANITFLNTDMSVFQIEKIINQRKFDVLILDDRFDFLSNKILSIKISEIKSLNNKYHLKLKRQQTGYISLLTGGTSGKVKFAKRKTSVFQILPPFLALLMKLNLDENKSVYIGVPVYHGYGLASMVMSVVLGAKIFFKDSNKQIISNNNIQVLILVPTQLQRILDRKENLGSVKKILSGGAKLDEALTKRVIKALGDVLYNLYGTSEAGFSILATPKDLKRYPATIGKPIKGVKMKFIPESVNKIDVGEIYIKTSWSISSQSYISTGDIVRINKKGYLFLKGRKDNMIVSGGENVYPIDIENILLENNDVSQVKVIAVDDVEFGKRLIAFIVSVNLSEQQVLCWLKTKIARYQMPSRIVIVEKIEFNQVGKVNKQNLISQFVNS